MDTSVTPNVLKRWDGTEWVAAGGEQGPQGPAGDSLFTWIKYANDELGNGMSDNPLNKKYIGIAYNKLTATESTNPSLYTWSLLKGEDGDQGIQGPAGIDGRSQYLHIAYSTSADGVQDFSTTETLGRTYIGTYTDFTPSDSTNPAVYKWARIKGEAGSQGPPGISNYTYIRYSANANGSPMTSTPDGSTAYIGFAVTTGAGAPTSNTAYTWSRYQGPQGIQGLQGLQGSRGDQGIQGPPGANGVSSYTHIAYATGTTGQNFSTAHFPTATYIGMYVDSNPDDSTNHTSYAWSLIKGADGTQGIQGPKGDDGLTPYFHTAWATNSTGTTGFSTTTSLGKTYIGTYTDYISTDSTDPSKYDWVLIKGEQGVQGIQGIQGPAGANGQTLYTWVKYADTPTTGMSDLPSGKTYIGLAYNKTTATESTNYADYSWSLIKGDQGIQGPAGANGQTLYTWIKYAATPTSGMSDSPTGLKYLGIAYNKTTSTESTNYADYEWSLIEGPQGPQGIQGPAGSNGQSQYVHIRYSANSSGTSMTTAPQSDTAYIGMAVTNSATAPTANTSYTWSLFKGPTGSQGIQGPAGTNGTTTYTWVKYADTELGVGMSDTPAGKRFIGLAFNKTTAVESTTASDYTWSPLYDNVKIGAKNLFRGFPTNDPLTAVVTASNYYGFDPIGKKTKIVPGETYTLSFDYEVLSTTITSGDMQVSVGYATETGVFVEDEITIYHPFTAGFKGSVVRTFVMPASATVGRDYFSYRFARHGTVHTSQVNYTNIQLEKGNVPSDWRPNPEDVDALINNKATIGALDQLSQIVVKVSSDLNFKAGLSEFEAMKKAYEERVALENIDKEEVAASLKTLEGRTILAETIAGDAKNVTNFIETVISESEEGIFISNKGSNTGILIGSDRISFLDGEIEVAYISNQTMQINHGIFVESATIAKYKFELIPGTQILAVQWVGE